MKKNAISFPSIKDALKSEPAFIQYDQQLSDSRWQKKRLEIFNRDNWRCRCCNVTNVKLNAHHLYYEKGKKAWEYEDEAIVTLCDNCHAIIHFELAKLAGLIAFEILCKRLDLLDYGRK